MAAKKAAIQDRAQFHFPTITSDAFTTATTLSPTASLRSSTASLVIEEAIITPFPMSILTWAVKLDHFPAQLISRA
jgi:hypothetical protein